MESKLHTCSIEPATPLLVRLCERPLPAGIGRYAGGERTLAQASVPTNAGSGALRFARHVPALLGGSGKTFDRLQCAGDAILVEGNVLEGAGVRASPASSSALAVVIAPWMACAASGAGRIPSLPANVSAKAKDVVLLVGRCSHEPVRDER
jgi:hypothetical protein